MAGVTLTLTPTQLDRSSRYLISRILTYTTSMVLPKPEQSVDKVDMDEVDMDEVDMDKVDMDEVDMIVLAWKEQRPDLDVSPLEVLSRLSRIARHLDLTRSQAFRNHQLESWEFDVLAALRRVGSPFALSPGALANATHVTSGTMTTRVDRLLERRFVSRFPDSQDRRGVQVQLTDLGKNTVDGAFTDLLERETQILVNINVNSQKELAGQLRQLLLHFDT